MARRTIHHSVGSYTEDRFIVLRIAERGSFAYGIENEMEFCGRDHFEGFGMARTAAKIYAGLLWLGGSRTTIPFVAELGPYAGHVVGRQSRDTKQGWRIDVSRRGEFHINWWDRRLDTSPQGDHDRSKHLYGANFIAGGTQQLFWELESHFPGRVG